MNPSPNPSPAGRIADTPHLIAALADTDAQFSWQFTLAEIRALPEQVLR